MLEYLGEAFKGHIEKGDSISVIDETGKYPATPRKINFLKGTKVIINEIFGPSNKYKITGWVAIDTQTHNNGFYGFNIYRKGQLVLTHDKTWFRAHLMTSRIIGEVNMDFLDATFYKQGVQQSEEWNYVSSYMREYLKGIVAASYDLSRKGNINKPAERKEIIAKLAAEYTISQEGDEMKDGDAPGATTESPKASPGIHETIKHSVNEKSLKLEDGTEIKITFIEKEEHASNVGPYDYIFDPLQEPAELQVFVYTEHPLCKNKIDSEVRKIVAVSDAIYRTLVVELGVDSRKALNIRNEWVTQRTESM